jgi:hypothetical protein
MSLEQRRRTFFKYEKRIRELSPPEKVRWCPSAAWRRWQPFCYHVLKAAPAQGNMQTWPFHLSYAYHVFASHLLQPALQVFEYFASQRQGKVFAMTAGDMLRSVVPVYPPEGSDVVRAGSLPGEPAPRVHQEEVGGRLAAEAGRWGRLRCLGV